MNRHQYDQLVECARNYMTQSTDSQHNWDHVLRVRDNARQIVQTLQIEEKIDSQILDVCCLLHDLHYVFYPGGVVMYLLERRRAVTTLTNILEQFNIDPAEKELIIDVIRHHPFAIPFKRLNKHRDLYSQVLQDADTLDMLHPQRIQSLELSRNTSVLFRLVARIAPFMERYTRPRLHTYLNFPELSQSDLSWQLKSKS